MSNVLIKLDEGFNASKKLFLEKFESAEEIEKFNRIFTSEIILFNTLLIEQPDLQKCTEGSLRMVLQNVITTGLTLATAMRECYVIKRGSQATLDISYIGLIKLLTNAGTVENIDAYPVYENDLFEYELGFKKHIKHVPVLRNRGKLLAVYAVAELANGTKKIEVLTDDDIQAVKSAPNSKTHTSLAWKNFESEMWRKSAIKRMFKYIAHSLPNDQLMSAMAIEHQNESTVTRIIDVDQTEKKEIFAIASEIVEDKKDRAEVKEIKVLKETPEETPKETPKKTVKVEAKKSEKTKIVEVKKTETVKASEPKIVHSIPKNEPKVVVMETVNHSTEPIESVQHSSNNAAIFGGGSDLNSLLNQFNN